ncbi:alpha-hydroxy-acid oxidizing protein [Ignatzschineria rhizosphaerae]|uniref:Alpha-hydroxy-acid oxidizing protein n=1 Tax=Ignatzschineria rhizosphaerae TaxID=2923279 RepID=A0ABY3X4H0_9GAMM|nr:alpha-hydroxy acid oxidase [Ignatzschineria rhizosphaerae]UNM96362.1 alpha-hydroxy-acid oxidizing protein [Ignatzschineria rhizosphaerae]
MTIITNIEDLRVVAKKRVPKMIYDYVDSGAWTESTYHANEADFQDIKLIQRVGVDISNIQTQREIVGVRSTIPLAISPTGLAGMVHPDGEILAAKAAAKFGVRYTLSTMSIASLEDIQAEVGEPFWFQLYVLGGRDFTLRLIERAKMAGCDALVLTLDSQMVGQRHKDIKNGLSVPPTPTLKNWINLISKQRWCWNMLKTKRREFGNIVGHVEGVNDRKSFAAWSLQQFDLSLNWKDVEWIKKAWGGKLIIKGILDPEDALIASSLGADAVVVSNHGGRQQDGALSSIKMLPSIVDRLKGTGTEIILDSGIRSGQDLLKSIALGATGGMIGRAYLYGLGAYGEKGVTNTLEIIQKEFETSMSFTGVTDIDRVDSNILIAATVPKLL